ncbi:twin-arginine translocation signal domain-containing protein [Terrabacter lapilli]|uniref:twin-arginine translocation signal domain-containing protein n=1 Tax=Terrabacter lapilli TaxID=436231 RepID=UPI003CD0AAE9
MSSSVNRRNFLGGAAATGLGIAISGSPRHHAGPRKAERRRSAAHAASRRERATTSALLVRGLVRCP